MNLKTKDVSRGLRGGRTGRGKDKTEAKIDRISKNLCLRDTKEVERVPVLLSSCCLQVVCGPLGAESFRPTLRPCTFIHSLSLSPLSPSPFPLSVYLSPFSLFSFHLLSLSLLSLLPLSSSLLLTSLSVSFFCLYTHTSCTSCCMVVESFGCSQGSRFLSMVPRFSDFTRCVEEFQVRPLG